MGKNKAFTSLGFFENFFMGLTFSNQVYLAYRERDRRWSLKVGGLPAIAGGAGLWALEPPF